MKQYGVGPHLIPMAIVDWQENDKSERRNNMEYVIGFIILAVAAIIIIALATLWLRFELAPHFGLRK